MSDKRTLSDAQIAEILQTYTRCTSLRETAIRTGHNPKTVTRYVKRAGLPIGPAHGRGGRADGRTLYGQPHVDDDERDRMIAMAHAGQSRAEIGRQLGRSPTTVRRHLRRANVPPADPAAQARKYPLNEAVFAVRTPARDYWAGFIAADGNVSGTKLTVNQMQSETNHLDRLRAFLQTTRPIHAVPTTQSVSFAVHSRQLARDLAALGITERKSPTLKLAEPLTVSPACWLGMLDGDGWLTGRGADGAPHLTWCGTEAVMNQLATFWSRFLGRRPAVFQRGQSGLWSVALSHRSAHDAAIVLLEAVPYSMPRKRTGLELAAAYTSVPMRRARAQH